LNADGSLGGVLTPLNYDCSDPFVTFGGGCYLVLGADNSASTRYVRFRRYSPGGTAIDGGASNLYSSASPVWDPRAAYNPGNHQFLVTWRDQATYQVLGRTLDAATAARGNIMTALVFNTWGSSDNAGVAYDGANWLCLFADNRGGAPGLFGTRVDSAGAVLDPTPFPVLYGGSSGELAAPIAPDTNTLILAPSRFTA
jgi:hypothetical protein